MTTDTASAPGRRAAGVHWDLSPLVADAAAARERLDAGLERSRAFEARYRGTLAGSSTAAGLAEALAELAEIDNELSRVSSYAHLRESVDVTDEENKDLSAAIDRGLVEAGNALRFFDLEWLALDDDARPRALRRARGGPRPPLPASRCAASRRTRCPSPRSGCSPSAARRRRARGRRCSARSPRPSRCRSTPARATASSRTPSTACSRTCATPTATCAGGRSRRSTTALEPHTDTLLARLRHAGRRPPGDGPAARLRGADGAHPPAQRAARRRSSRRCSTRSSATTGSRSAGSGSRPASSASTASSCTTSTRRSARRARSPTPRRDA